MSRDPLPVVNIVVGMRSGTHPHVGERVCLKFASGVVSSIEDRLDIVDARVLRISGVIVDMLENRLVAVQVPHAT